MVDVRTEIIIKRPIKEVSEYAMNPDHAPEWYVNIQSVEWKTSRPLKIGSHLAFKAQFLGRELAYIYEIVELLLGEKLVMKTANGPFPMETTYTFHKVDDQTTRMILRNQGVPSGFSKLVSPFMSSLMERANKKDLKKIKSILERP